MGNLRDKLLHDRRSYSMTFWAVFIGLVLIPALAFAIELGRYFYAISEVQKAADAAAVAAAAEINQRVFQDTGSLIPTSKTWANAQSYVSSNIRQRCSCLRNRHSS
jgi:Flp pilus assembly protein TadG